ncbi:MAG: N-acetylmuramoyl-L-alanine amidase [Granulosicoccus sp.]|nr:N-acetylmuramoyl-L-alanine amidase [Granulosicoccus sp.]
MDIKLLGSSGAAALAIFALIAQYGSGTQASSLHRLETAHRADTVSMLTPPTRAQAPTGVHGRPRPSPHPPVRAALRSEIVPSVIGSNLSDDLTAAPVTRMSSFAIPGITGFLKPGGFDRPAWQRISQLTALAAPEADVEPFIVMLDPGHGGTDPGAEAHNGLLEKHLTLDIARRARLFLSEFDHIEVVLTRDHDHGLSRQARVNAIQRSRADMVVSLHFNHLPQSEITLVETYYAGPDNIAASLSRQGRAEQQNAGERLTKTRGSQLPDFGFTRGSERLARTLQQRMFAEVSHENPLADNAGVKKETLFVLTRSFTPGVLIELTCLSNEQEAVRLDSEAYRDRLAAALVDGIRTYRDSLVHSPLDTLTDIGV